MKSAMKRRPAGLILRAAAWSLLAAGLPSTAAGSPEASKTPPCEAPGGNEERFRPGAFNPEGLRDPFKPFIVEQEAESAGRSRKPRTYLETVDLSQLELIAVVLGSEDSWAMVRDAKGIGYVVKAGTPIGIDGGHVHEVRPGEIIVRSGQGRQGTVVRETRKRLEPGL